MDTTKWTFGLTMMIFGMGFFASCMDTVAGVSAFPMAARVVQVQGQLYDKKNHLLMHAAGVNTGGQIGSVVAAAVMLSVLKGMGLI